MGWWGLVWIPVAFVAWSGIHETAHYVAVGAFREVTRRRFRLYPHRTPTGWVYASVEWEVAPPDLSPREVVWVYAAPRVPDLVACLLTPFAGLMGSWAVTWAVLFGAGLVDLAVGSIGSSPDSDLRIVARASGVSPWAMRVTGWWFVFLSAIFTFTIW